MKTIYKLIKYERNVNRKDFGLEGVNYHQGMTLDKPGFSKPTDIEEFYDKEKGLEALKEYSSLIKPTLRLAGFTVTEYVLEEYQISLDEEGHIDSQEFIGDIGISELKI